MQVRVLPPTGFIPAGDVFRLQIEAVGPDPCTFDGGFSVRIRGAGVLKQTFGGVVSF